jgi:hypothetical protein
VATQLQQLGMLMALPPLPHARGPVPAAGLPQEVVPPPPLTGNAPAGGTAAAAGGGDRVALLAALESLLPGDSEQGP